jgi:hypothetical protein
MVEKSFRFSMSRPELVCQSREARRIRPRAPSAPCRRADRSRKPLRGQDHLGLLEHCDQIVFRVRIGPA